MRTILLVITSLTVAATVTGQEVATPPTQPRESVSIGGLVLPAMEGGGPWFMESIRLSAPLGGKYGADVELGRILGGTNKYSRIRTYYAAQLRRARRAKPGKHGQPPLGTKYWLFGLGALNVATLDSSGGIRARAASTFVTIGSGWSRTLANGVRVQQEAGFRGGDGFLFYLSWGLQWGPPRSPASRASE